MFLNGKAAVPGCFRRQPDFVNQFISFQDALLNPRRTPQSEIDINPFSFPASPCRQRRCRPTAAARRDMVFTTAGLPAPVFPMEKQATLPPVSSGRPGEYAFPYKGEVRDRYDVGPALLRTDRGSCLRRYRAAQHTRVRARLLPHPAPQSQFERPVAGRVEGTEGNCIRGIAVMLSSPVSECPVPLTVRISGVSSVTAAITALSPITTGGYIVLSIFDR